MVEVFREGRRVLRDDGTCWINIGDSYAGSGRSKGSGGCGPSSGKQTTNKGAYFQSPINGFVPEGIKSKDLVGIPWMLAFALRADGWYLRQDIIWCLSGGTWLYARTQKGDMPIMVRDLHRLNPETVQLWNGKKWTQLKGMSKSERKGDELEIVLRSGERISCTPSHKFPTNKGLLEASALRVGDVLKTVKLPEPEAPKQPKHIDSNAAWIAGLFIAEGSKSEDTIQIAGHVKEIARWERLQRIAEEYGGSITRTVNGNKMDIRLYGKVLNSIIDELVSGKTAKDKCFAPVVWKYSDEFLASLLEGYLDGDGHHDVGNHRWRIGFTRNYNLERDLRTACARLGYKLTLKLSTSTCNGKRFPSFRGEIRHYRSGHWNESDMGEVVQIRKARCRYVYDLGVEDDPHVFALASGILTHNSKPNPMPESVRDRCTKSHEYLFLLSKSERYFYDAETIKEKATFNGPNAPDAIKSPYGQGFTRANGSWKGSEFHTGKTGIHQLGRSQKIRGVIVSEDRKELRSDIESRHRSAIPGGQSMQESPNGYRNKRSVWSVSTCPFSEAHFATFPPDLIKPCILAGSRPGDIVIDPFMGSGTTAIVAKNLGRNYVGIELSPVYAEMADRRIKRETAQLNLFHTREASK